MPSATSVDEGPGSRLESPNRSTKRWRVSQPRRSTNSRCMMAICAAGPPKAVSPRRVNSRAISQRRASTVRRARSEGRPCPDATRPCCCHDDPNARRIACPTEPLLPRLGTDETVVFLGAVKHVDTPKCSMRPTPITRTVSASRPRSCHSRVRLNGRALVPVSQHQLTPDKRQVSGWRHRPSRGPRAGGPTGRPRVRSHREWQRAEVF